MVASSALALPNKAVLFRRPSAPAYDPAAQALFAVLSTQPSDTIKAAINTAIVDLKTINAWDDYDRLWPFGAMPTSADSLIDWKNPSGLPLVIVNSPVFTAYSDWQGDASSARLRTQYTPSTDAVKFTANDASISLWSLTDATVSTIELGNVTSSPRAEMSVKWADGNSYAAVNSPTEVFIAVADSLGFYIGQRRASNDLRLFKNGVQIATSAIASAGLPTQEQWVCASNSGYYSNKKLALVAWGASQAGREAAIYNIFLTLFQATGAVP